MSAVIYLASWMSSHFSWTLTNKNKNEKRKIYENVSRLACSWNCGPASSLESCPSTPLPSARGRPPLSSSFLLLPLRPPLLPLCFACFLQEHYCFLTKTGEIFTLCHEKAIWGQKSNLRGVQWWNISVISARRPAQRQSQIWQSPSNPSLVCFLSLPPSYFPSRSFFLPPPLFLPFSPVPLLPSSIPFLSALILILSFPFSIPFRSWPFPSRIQCTAAAAAVISGSS